jgi:hypothetical protein
VFRQEVFQRKKRSLFLTLINRFNGKIPMRIITYKLSDFLLEALSNVESVKRSFVDDLKMLKKIVKTVPKTVSKPRLEIKVSNTPQI